MEERAFERQQGPSIFPSHNQPMENSHPGLLVNEMSFLRTQKWLPALFLIVLFIHPWPYAQKISNNENWWLFAKLKKKISTTSATPYSRKEECYFVFDSLTSYCRQHWFVNLFPRICGHLRALHLVRSWSFDSEPIWLILMGRNGFFTFSESNFEDKICNFHTIITFICVSCLPKPL